MNSPTPEREFTLIQWREMSPEQQERVWIRLVEHNTRLGQGLARLKQDLAKSEAKQKFELDLLRQEVRSVPARSDRFLSKLLSLWGKEV